MDKKKVKNGGMLLAGLIIVALFVVFIVKTGSTQTITLQCNPLPEGSFLSEVKKGVYTLEGTTGQVLILEGFTTGLPSESVTDITDMVPACYAGMEGFSVFKGLRLVDEDGKMFVLIKGVGTSATDGAKSTPLS